MKKLSLAIAIVLTLLVFGPKGYELTRPHAKRMSMSFNKATNMQIGQTSVDARHNLSADPPTPISTSYEVFADTADGADEAKDFAKNSYDWFICNLDGSATDTLLVNINSASAADITVAGGSCLSVNTMSTGIVYVSQGTGGAPLYQLVAFERQ